MDVDAEHPQRTRSGRAFHGSMMIELLIGCVVALLTGAALVSLQQSSYVAASTVQGQNYANTSSRRPLDVLADTLRNAQSVGTGIGQALVSASTSDVTCYTATGTTRIWLDANTQTLRRSKDNSGNASSAPIGNQITANNADTNGATVGSPGSGNSGSEALVSKVQSLQLTYYVPGGNAYNAGFAGWTTTADPNNPTSAELPNIGAVGIVATINNGGETRTLQSFVRLRNSPNTHDS